jgi:hypothetical protein
MITHLIMTPKIINKLTITIMTTRQGIMGNINNKILRKMMH